MAAGRRGVHRARQHLLLLSTRTAAASSTLGRPERAPARARLLGQVRSPTTRRRTARAEGRSRRANAGSSTTGTWTSAWSSGSGRTYLIAGDEYIRYSTGSYQYADAAPATALDQHRGPAAVEATPSCSPTRTSTYSFDNNAKTCTRTQGGSTETFPTADLAQRTVRRAARHRRGLRPRRAAVPGRAARSTSATRSPAASVPDFVDPGYPEACSVAVDALVEIGGQIHVFSGDRYGRLAAGAELDTAVELKPIQGNWGNLPYRFRDGPRRRRGDRGRAVPVPRRAATSVTPPTAPSGVPITLPYELTSARYEIIRLTTGTAVTLNQRLLAGGVPAVLATVHAGDGRDARRSTSAGRRRRSSRSSGTAVDDAHLPVSSHLDFDSANGIYYWEAFFHAPLLIAQALQRGAAVRRGEAVVRVRLRPDPGPGQLAVPAVPRRRRRCARRRLHGGVRRARRYVRGRRPPRSSVTLLDRVGTLAPVFAQEREVRGDEEAVLRRDLPRLAADLTAYVARTADDLRRAPARRRRWRRRCGASRRPRRSSRGSSAATTSWWAGSRPRCAGTWTTRSTRTPSRRCAPAPTAAPSSWPTSTTCSTGATCCSASTPRRASTRRACSTCSPTTCWGSGRASWVPGRCATPSTTGSSAHEPGEYDMLLRAAVDSASTAPHSSAAPPEDGAYFVVPENAQLGDYWTRVEDRLRKIRQSQDILGVGRPLPLFEPPIDPAALVAAVASGLDVAAAAAAGAPVPVPHYRFAFMLRRAQDLVQRLGQLGSDLLGVLERRDAEELTLLQSRHEGAILAMTRAIKEDQVGVARANLAELAESEAEARNRQTHYQRLLDQGMSPLEQAQVGLMISASAAHQVAAALKLAAGIAHAFPQSKIGLFIAGIETGGDQAGSSIDKFSEFSESLGEGLSVTGEVLGTFASHQRMAEDWELQVSTAPQRPRADRPPDAGGDAAGGRRRARPRHDRAADRAQRVRRDVPHGQVRQRPALPVDVRPAVRGSTCRRTAWPTTWPGPPSARSSSSAASTRPTRSSSGRRTGRAGATACWRARPSAGTSSGMATAYQDADSRGMEITKRISLAELDPVALLRLKARRHVRVHVLRGPVRLRLPRPLPAPDPVGLGRLRRRLRRADHAERGPHPARPQDRPAARAVGGEVPARPEGEPSLGPAQRLARRASRSRCRTSRRGRRTTACSG